MVFGSRRADRLLSSVNMWHKATDDGNIFSRMACSISCHSHLCAKSHCAQARALPQYIVRLLEISLVRSVKGDYHSASRKPTCRMKGFKRVVCGNFVAAFYSPKEGAALPGRWRPRDINGIVISFGVVFGARKAFAIAVSIKCCRVLSASPSDSFSP